ncbi:hypothetical protein N9V96_00400 [Polaribacter sp.]|nr:hypothetical protein [Polaribacter sp.]
MMATILATYKTMQIAEKEFPSIHNLHNKANAFRHALWNILIAKNCLRFSSNNEAILNWTKNITDWHEDFSPNKIMARKMDLHNNAFGRNQYNLLKEKNNREIILYFKAEMTKAKQIKQESQFENFRKNLVYLESTPKSS